jgi:hypothetical protein
MKRNRYVKEPEWHDDILPILGNVVGFAVLIGSIWAITIVLFAASGKF